MKIGRNEREIEIEIRYSLSKKELEDLDRQTERYNSECGECITVVVGKNKSSNKN